MRSVAGPVLLMLGAFTALEISENTTGKDAEPTRQGRSSHEPLSIERLTAPGIDNFHRLASGLYSGSQPRDRSSFEALAKLGVKTIVSVDGGNPDASAARDFGIRTVHLPLGYNGIDTAQSARLIKAARTLPGPIYIHCRHGQHRGPAAAALVAMATEGWTVTQALGWLKTAGTSRDYPGLYNALKMFQIPSNTELTVVPDDWPDSTEIPMATQAMLDIDACWERLKASPNPAVASELVRHYRGLAHAPSFGEDFHKRLLQAIDNAEALRERLEQSPLPLDKADREITLERSGRDCKTCHEAHRN